jgi:hypothetical protein
VLITLRQIFQSAVVIDDKHTKDVALKKVSQDFATSGDIQLALEVTAAITSSSYKAEALRAIAKAQAKAGDDAGTRATFHQLLKVAASKNAEILREITAAQARRGDLKGAIRWSVSQTTPSESAYALLGAAEGILAINEVKIEPRP